MNKCKVCTFPTVLKQCTESEGDSIEGERNVV